MSTAGTSLGTGTVLADRWVLARQIGSGASSNVFAARDPKLDRWVAIKVLHPSLASDLSFLEQFNNEARAVSALDTDGVVRFYDVGTHEVDGREVPYIVTALMEGGSLEGLLKAGTRLDVAQAVELGRGAARGLAAAHEVDIVHSDVKPANLLFDADGRVALSDFGISRVVATATSTEPIGSASGTTRYASPEQMEGRTLDGRSDVYSLALVLMESVTGVVPLLADTVAGTVALRSAGSIDVSVDFGALRGPLQRATEADPQRRYDSAEFLSALAGAAERVGDPRPLPLARLQGLEDQTSELRVGRDSAGLVVLGPLVADTPGGAGAADADDGVVDLASDGAAEGNGSDSSPAGIAGSAAAAAASGSGGAAVHQDDLIDLTDGHLGGGATGEAHDPGSWDDHPQDALDDTGSWGADSIAAADHHARLMDSRPSTSGPVEPLQVSDAPGAVASAAAGTRAVAGPDAKSGRAGKSGKSRKAPKSPKPAKAHNTTKARGGPRWRRWVAIVVAVLLLAGAAFAGWWFLIRVPSHEVPDLVGGDLAAAEAIASENSWTAEVVDQRREDGTSVGQVLGQDPGPGTELAEGEVLALTVSQGPTLTALPQIAGLAEPEAMAALEAAGLVAGGRSTDFNEDAPAGVVLLFAPAGGVEPDAEGRVPKGTPVDFIVSDGPAPRVVPGGLVGASRSNAVAAIEGVQLVANVSTEYSDTVDEGIVISVAVAPGSEVPRGSEVPIVVSAGPQPIIVPNVVGQTGSSAAATLEGAGFTVSGIEGSPTGTVLATDPVAGESRLPGSSVRIFTRQ